MEYPLIIALKVTAFFTGISSNILLASVVRWHLQYMETKEVPTRSSWSIPYFTDSACRDCPSETKESEVHTLRTKGRIG
ncbi:hypothetical protein C4D60_Mb07t04170 [Musa balbisiana]|uniref:Uncharacterized protein n=1 Tax=Musa balbisiana TaxID=52838 RepID=A0A4S8JCU6_MUSBA|nr:hypothetical protein C4D60_Mb07t04170 [Musa balbisiana]